jgi:NADPH:quinone reductase-like Zn-dependent oxidoreductase
VSRAVIYETFGGPEVLELREVPDPHAGLGAVVRAASRGALRLPIARTVPLSQAIPALTELEQGGTANRGKLIVTPG